jgi:hypothetical protein
MSMQTLSKSLDRPGWLTFAAVALFSAGVLQVISAIYFFSNSSRIEDLSGGAFGRHLWLWGIWELVLAALAFAGARSLLAGGTFGRVIGYLWAGLVVIESLMIISRASAGGFASLAIGVLVLYALTTTSSWQEPT